MNYKRILLGGLLAGLVLNIGETILNVPVLGAQNEAAMQRLGLPTEMAGSTIALFVVLCFLAGIFSVWLYAAVRPRLGAGAKTAVITGLVVWFFAIFFPYVGIVAMGLLPAKLAMISGLWELVEIPLAVVAGAWLYNEEALQPAHAGAF